MFPSNLMKNTNFPNMARVSDCDKWIEKELLEAGVPISKYISVSEVPFHIVGKLGDFTFKRCWYYYSVRGNVPLEIANELYNNPIGKKDVRVVGHCGCPAPKKWCEKIEGKEYITSYHIDSQEGLNLFVEKIKKII